MRPKREKNTETEPALLTSSAASPMQKITEAAQSGKLIVIIGAGMSMALTNGQAASWKGLLQNGFDYAAKKGRIKVDQMAFWKPQLGSSDIDDMLGAAEFLSRKLGKDSQDQLYARWLEEALGDLVISNIKLSSAVKKLSEAGALICTLNYDHLLEKATGFPTVLISETNKVASLLRRETSGILHLHGAYDTPQSCILGIKDYATTQVDAVRDLFQRNMAVLNRILFIGCGDTLSDPNFSALIHWLRTTYVALTPQHFALTIDSDVSIKGADPTWAGFVEPLGYGPSHNDLAAFLSLHFQSVKKKRALKTDININNGQVIEDYLAFLLRDCGQMTIEGVSNDMDTGQRRFDLERLFVPLNVSACPPEFEQSDPERDKKLKKWKDANKSPEPFGKILTRGKNLALLALPGGGKTLLLKRLAVAYSDKIRRNSSSDELPDLNVIPVLIRCRDWRSYITLPILTLLKNIGDITGQPNLSGFSDAIVPMLKKGQVLLLVDGLDEIHNDTERATFVDNLASFLRDYKKTRLVVTSREAGFNLVAPSLAGFCERWRLAPLEADAITSLCHHWHKLMVGETPEAESESGKVAEALLHNQSLRRLAENPLLLTMLLVVKHGAGGLPPDRVSLYGRAVEVLLDTWNIKGHAPLNAREAVPQLSYVAYRLMCLGKQTATEKELLTLLAEARENLPSLKWYAKDSPHDFLKRVELRSSLLLEAGHLSEHGRTVPFYQFRHLTFQEYLTAIAVTEGNYDNYEQNDDVLKPLGKNLLTDEWKEIIPMVAVLARKQAEPLMATLVAESQKIKDEILNGDKNVAPSVLFKGKTPAPLARLMQCVMEEAEALPNTLAAALELIVFFGRGCRDQGDWEALCQGPYANVIFSYAWNLFKPMNWHPDLWMLNTCGSIAALQKPLNYWLSDLGKKEVNTYLSANNSDDVGRGLLICMGMIWKYSMPSQKAGVEYLPIKEIEKHLFHSEEYLHHTATWIWLVMRRDVTEIKEYIPTKKVLNRLLKIWLSSDHPKVVETAAYALSINIGVDRSCWRPKLTKANADKVLVRLRGVNNGPRYYDTRYMKKAAFFISYHATNLVSDQELLSIVDAWKDNEDPLINRSLLRETKERLRAATTPGR